MNRSLLLEDKIMDTHYSNLYQIFYKQCLINIVYIEYDKFKAIYLGINLINYLSFFKVLLRKLSIISCHI